LIWLQKIKKLKGDKMEKMYITGKWEICESFWYIIPEKVFFDKKNADGDYAEVEIGDKQIVEYDVYRLD
jgi:hypothetical protein